MAAMVSAWAWPASAVASEPALAPDDEPRLRRARRVYELAERHFHKGRYRAALRDYQTAFALSRLPGFLLNMAHCQLQLGDLAKARGHYRHYLTVADPHDPHRGRAVRALAEVDAQLASTALSRSGSEPEGDRDDLSLPIGKIEGELVAVANLARPARRRDEVRAPAVPRFRAAPVEIAIVPVTPPRALAMPVAGRESMWLDTGAEGPRQVTSWSRWVWPTVIATAVVSAAVAGYFLLGPERDFVEEGSIGTLSR